ncbi:MAG: phage/plasmid primase, P4 family [Deltaproteobacteria bacterium]
MDNAVISDKERFKSEAGKFLKAIHGALQGNTIGETEIRVFPKEGLPRKYFSISIDDAIKKVFELCNTGIDVYFGVNPRMNRGGKKENVHYVTAFHSEVDYGTEGHKKAPIHKTYDDALNAINSYVIKPTIINHSGGGFHCYWVLRIPISVKDIGATTIENINKALSEALGGDSGTQDISRVLRVPGTYNFKIEGNPREVTTVVMNEARYDFDEIASKLNTVPEDKKKRKAAAKSKDIHENDKPKPENLHEGLFECENIPTEPAISEDFLSYDYEDSLPSWDGNIESLVVSDKVKQLIMKGNDGSYPSRSECDMAVIASLVSKKVSDTDIEKIFEKYQIGEKYREHRSKEKYLQYTIKKAKNLTALSPEEMLNPLFVAGALSRNDKGYSLDILKFQEYMTKKYNITIYEGFPFQYNGQCYERKINDELNYLCQSELSKHRGLFTKKCLDSFMHYAKGDVLQDQNKANEDMQNYLTFKNGLFSLKDARLINHTHHIFTTNLLPYELDHNAKCPRFLQFLAEIFVNDKKKIEFVQEAVGYCFHKSLIVASVFFLVGDGSNGKSVFLDAIANLFGEQNICNFGLNSLNKEYYLLGLFGKMANLSSETPAKAVLNTDLFKAVTSGDTITGREPYQLPVSFKPFAKHFIAMNEIPNFKDFSYGLLRRLYIIDFPRRFSKHEQDVHRSEKLKKELPGIFNWAYEGYKRLKNNNFSFTEAISMEQSKKNYKENSNSIFAFASMHLKKDKDRFKKLKIFEKSINYGFRSKLLLNQALTHKSYSNEKDMEQSSDNERLEFLGDSVLGLIISHMLYNEYKLQELVMYTWDTLFCLC